MAIKAGQIIHVGNGAVVIDRIQTAGPGNVNIPVETIYELGNYQSIAQIRDTPDLSFSMESYDVSTEIESLLVGGYAGRSTADGATTAGSPNVTSATAAFTSADVGRTITVAGAGVAGGLFTATILSITSGTVVVTDTNATGTVTGAALTVAQTVFSPANAVPIDMKSVFKSGLATATPYDTVDSVGLPFLTLEQVQYRFGLKEDARQTATLRGDSIYYNPGSTYVESTAGTGAANQTVVTAHPAYSIDEGGVTRRVLDVMVGTKRLVFGIDYTESYGTVTNGAAVTTLTLLAAVPTTSTIQIMYSSPTVETFGTGVHAPVSATKPAAIRGRDIAVYLGGYNPAAPYTNRVLGVQAVNVDWRVQLQKDEEFGNYHAVAQDYDVPSVTGSIQVKPADAPTLIALMQKITGAADATKTATATSAPALALDIVLHSPTDGSVLKRLHVPDARLTLPGFSGRVQQKLDVTMNFGSDTGTLVVSQA